MSQLAVARYGSKGQGASTIYLGGELVRKQVWIHPSLFEVLLPEACAATGRDAVAPDRVWPDRKASPRASGKGSQRVRSGRNSQSATDTSDSRGDQDSVDGRRRGHATEMATKSNIISDHVAGFTIAVDIAMARQSDSEQ